ncbi:MAG: hypothetical protein PVI97_00340 [Candidatus Thiodiazotropha sp.]|jgi:hypothetical protein
MDNSTEVQSDLQTITNETGGFRSITAVSDSVIFALDLDYQIWRIKWVPEYGGRGHWDAERVSHSLPVRGGEE